MEKRILKKLEEHDLRFDHHDKRFDQLDQRLDQHGLRFDQHDKRFDNVFNKLLDHDDELKWLKENTATKEDIRGLAITLDDLVGLYKKTVQELIFMGHRLDRVEGKVFGN